jgi:cellulose synthase (UDP-forming)
VEGPTPPVEVGVEPEEHEPPVRSPTKALNLEFAALEGRRFVGHAPPAVRTLIILNIGAAAAYVTWWLNTGHIGTPILFYLLAAAEGFTLLHLLGFWWAVWATRFEEPPKPSWSYAIDVYIPTLGEPLEVLERTVSAAVEMDVPHRTFILDDSGRDEVEKLAERLGAAYIRRTARRGAKAGNLNHALRLTDGDLVAVFDADHAPRRDFLKRLLGYFNDPKCAFVQTPQYYGNAHDNEVAQGAYQQQAMFYGPICRGKNGLGAAFCCGTNVIFRRTALQDVGGFDPRSVVEDFVTSMRIHRRGWRSVYYPYVLAEGIGPGDLRTYLRQQYRWARGSIGALLSLEPFKPGFSLGQRFQYLLATTFYLIGLVTLIYLALPVVYLLGGQSAFSRGSGTFVFFYLPYLLLALTTIRWGLGDQLRLEHLRYTFGAFPVYAMAAVASLLHLPARFRVTSKSGRQAGRIPPFGALLALLVFVVVCGAIGVGFLLRPLNATTFTNMAWAAVNLILLVGIVGAALREAFRRGHARSSDGAFGRRPEFIPVAGGSGVITRPAPGAVADADALMLPENAIPPPERREIRERVRLDSFVTVGILTAVGLGIRIAFINFQSLRLDESLSLGQVQDYSLSGLVDFLISVNVHVPLYHILLKGWVAIAGTAEWAIRIPSVVFGTAAIPLMYVIARRLISPRAAVYAAAVGAASPFWVWHSDEARMYPLLLFLALASLALLFHALERGGTWRWVAYSLVTGISFYSHYFALLMPAVHLAYLLISRTPPRKLLPWLGAMAGAGAMFVPWVVGLYFERIQGEGLGAISSGIRLPPQDYSFFGILYGFLFFLMVYVIGYGEGLGRGSGILAVLSRIVAGSWPLIVLVGMTSRKLGRFLRSRTTIFLTAWILLTVGVVFALSLWKPGLWLQRYLVIASPAVYIASGAGFARLFRRHTAGVVAVVAMLLTLTIFENIQPTNPVREDFRGAARIIEGAWEPGDAVLVMPEFYDEPLEYYLDVGPVIPTLSSERPPELVVRYDVPAIARAHRGSTLWVILVYKDAFDPTQELRTYLDVVLDRVTAYRLGGEMLLREYRIPSDFGRLATPIGPG